MAEDYTYNFDFTEEQRDAIIKRVFAGAYDIDNLPKELVESLFKTLNTAIDLGYGGIEFGAIDEALIEALRENVFMFSTAKTFSQIAEMQFNLVDEKNNMLSFPEFKKKATDIFTKYQGGMVEGEIKPGWLEAEYNTAIAQANNAKRWNQVEAQKHILPYLRYSTSGSPCPDCAPLDGITLPVDDPFWDDYMPENHYNCNCVVEQIEKEDGEKFESDEDEIDSAIENANIDDNFRFNPGKIAKVFNSNHPYFDGFDIDNTNISMPRNFKKFNIKNKLNMDSNSVAVFVSRLIESEAQAHIFHLQTKSFAKHSALNELYNGISGLRDEFVEKYQGKYGIITGYDSVDLKDLTEDSDAVNYVKKVVIEIEAFRNTLKDGYLQQIVDNIVDLFYGVIYKLNNLS